MIRDSIVDLSEMLNVDFHSLQAIINLLISTNSSKLL